MGVRRSGRVPRGAAPGARADTDAPPQRFSAAPALEPERLVKAPLHADARRVAVRFIQTAVARENLEEAWTLVGPNLRAVPSRKRWLTGDNPVVPYPIDELEVAPYKVDESYTTRALLASRSSRKGSAFARRCSSSSSEARNAEACWVVDNWAPRASAVVPR